MVMPNRPSRLREAKKRYTIEKYGFCWGEKPNTPEEIAGRKRYDADRQRATAERNKRIDELINGRKRKIQAERRYRYVFCKRIWMAALG